jgi:hypothetical protein
MVGAARRTPPRLHLDPNRAPTACDRVAKLFCVSDFGNCARALTRPNLTPSALGRLAFRHRIEFVGDCGTLGVRCESPDARTGVEGSNPRRGARSRTHHIEALVPPWSGGGTLGGGRRGPCSSWPRGRGSRRASLENKERLCKVKDWLAPGMQPVPPPNSQIGASLFCASFGWRIDSSALAPRSLARFSGIFILAAASECGHTRTQRN